MEKIRVSQETLYRYMLDHGIIISRLAELIDRAPEVVLSCFKHHKDSRGKPRSFNARNIEAINKALPILADNIRSCLLAFGSEQMFTNKRGITYDPALVEPIKKLGKYINITELVWRLFGWSKGKKSSVLTEPSSKVYGHIGIKHAEAINNEILSIAGVLCNYELISDDATDETGNNTCVNHTDENATVGSESYNNNDKPVYAWDDTSLSLKKRAELFRKEYPDGILLFKMNDTYTSEGDDAVFIHSIENGVCLHADAMTGMTIANMDEEILNRFLSYIIKKGRRVGITEMCKKD